jgi:hypothetical protein
MKPAQLPSTLQAFTALAPADRTEQLRKFAQVRA